MKVVIAIVLVVLSITTLILGEIFKLEKEKTFYKKTIHEKHQIISEGIGGNWENYLLNKFNQGKIKEYYSLLWNTKTQTYAEVFFPTIQSSLNWSEYRKAIKIKNQTNKRLKSSRKFLKASFKEKNSWDRALGVYEWFSRFNAFPPITLSKFEQTLVDKEAYLAYSIIIKTISKYLLFHAAGESWTYKHDLHLGHKILTKRVSPNTVEVAYPSTKWIDDHLLPRFLTESQITAGYRLNNPFDIDFTSKLIYVHKKSKIIFYEYIFWIISVLLLIMSLILFFLSFQDNKKLLLRKVTFLNQIVHELKTPLTTLTLHLQILKKELSRLTTPTSLTAENSKISSSLSACLRGIERINKLFDEIVVLNRDKQKAALENLEPNELNEILESLQERYQSKLQIQSYFHQAISVDKVRLNIILNNLITNAIRYGNHSYLDIKEKNRYISITIKDDGPGVLENDKNKIFTEFYRSEKAKNISSNGLGLGLFICRKLAREMNGSVQIVNPGEEKACFELVLTRGK